MKTMLQRFTEKYTMDEASGCWIWTAVLDKKGYALFRDKPRTVRAYRWAYEQKHGRVPTGMELDHLCRVRACVNPDHLEVVTHLENMRRGLYATKTICPRGHTYTEENTYVVKVSGHRHCRQCRRDRRAIEKANRPAKEKKSACKYGHVFDEANTYYYGKQRHCRACQRRREKGYREENRRIANTLGGYYGRTAQ